MCDLYKLLLEVARREDRRADLQRRLPEPLDHGDRADRRSAWSQEEFPEKGDIPIVTTPTDDIRSYHVNSDKITRVLGFQAEAHDRGRGPRPVRGVQGGQAARQHGRRPSTSTSGALKELKAAMSARPIAVVTGGAGFIGSHMVDLLLERGFAVRVDRQPGRRTAREPRAPRGDAGFHARASATSGAVAPGRSAVPRRELRLPLRRHRRHRAVDRAAARVHVGERAGHGARARVRAARAGREVRLRRVVVVLRPRRRCRRARTIRSRRSIPTR